jgi:hypothetical protein
MTNNSTQKERREEPKAGEHGLFSIATQTLY